MLRSSLSKAFFCIVAAAVLGTGPALAQEDGYRINGGDLLHISVYGEQNLDKDVPVQPDGGIAFPLVGNLNARGMWFATIVVGMFAKCHHRPHEFCAA